MPYQVENFDNDDNKGVDFLNAVEDVLGAAPAQGSAIVSFTDNTTGTGGDTLADATATFSQSITNNNIASLSDKIEEILAALRTHGLIAT